MRIDEQESYYESVFAPPLLDRALVRPVVLLDHPLQGPPEFKQGIGIEFQRISVAADHSLGLGRTVPTLGH